MKSKLAILSLTFLLTSSLAAMEEGAAAGAQTSANQITIELTDGVVNLDKDILMQSETIKNFLAFDPEEKTVSLKDVDISKDQFEQAFELMKQLYRNDSQAIDQIISSKNIQELSLLWQIFNYLDVPDLLKSVNTDLTQKLVAQVKQNPQAIPELFEQIPDEFKKRTKLSSAQLESLLPEEIKNKLINNLATLTDHTSYVYSVAFDPTHNLLATASSGTVNIYDVTNKDKIRKLTTLTDHTRNVSSVAFDPIHNLLATGSTDATVNIYDVTNKDKIRKLTTLTNYAGTVRSVAFDPTHNLLATGVGDATVHIYDVTDKDSIRKLTTLKDHRSFVNSVAFDPTHNLLATGSDDRTVHIYDVSGKDTIRKLTTLKDHDQVYSVAFDPTHNLLATGSYDRTVHIYDVSDKDSIKKLTSLTDHTNVVRSVAFDPIHNLLATGSDDKTVTIYDVSDKDTIRKLSTLTDHAGAVRSVAFDPEHNLLATGSNDGTVNIYDLSLLNSFKNLTFSQALAVIYLLQVKPQTLSDVPEDIQDQINSLDPAVRQIILGYPKSPTVMERIFKFFKLR